MWQKLETENQEFFRAYHLRLIVKDQILRFNQLLERQVELMHQIGQTGVVPIPLSNGSQTHSSKLAFGCDDSSTFWYKYFVMHIKIYIYILRVCLLSYMVNYLLTQTHKGILSYSHKQPSPVYVLL